MLIDLDIADLLGEFLPNPFVEDLHEGQKRLYYEPARFRCGLMGRRFGKTYTAAAALLGGHPGDVSLYFTRKFIDAKAIILPVFREINYLYDLGLSFNLSDHTITEANGAIIRLAGVKDESAAEDLRGPRYRRVIGDELGTFHSELLQYTIESVVQPALVDSGGDFMGIGTPGPDPDPEDYWFQLTGDPATGIPGKWPTQHGTIYQNTKAKVDPRIALGDILEQNKWTVDHPTFRREYLAEWVPDVGSLVFDYLGRFEPGPDSGLTVLSLDFGVVDHTSFTVLRQLERPHVWVMQSYGLPNLDIMQIAETVNGLRQRWRPNYIVADEGALGKGYALTLSRQYNIPVEPAEKRHLRARIDHGRGMLANGLVHLTPEARELFDEWKRLPWNPLKTGFHDRYKADCCLVGDTLIETPVGPQRIDELSVGDTVETPVGPRKVAGHWLTNDDSITYAARLSSGETLRGTWNHPVWVDGTGWVPLALLEQGDILAPWGMAKAPACTARYGQRQTGPFPPASTHSTIDSITSSAYLAESMQRNTRSRISRSRLKRALLQLPGMAPMLVAHGIAAMGKRYGGQRRPPLGFVHSAAMGSSQSEEALRFALRAALPPLAEHRVSTISKEHARSVLGVFRTSNAATWNLTVEGCPVFYASGVLTHNTDGWLYGLQKINALEAYKPPEDTRTEEERIKDMVRANAMRIANRATRERWSP